MTLYTSLVKLVFNGRHTDKETTVKHTNVKEQRCAGLLCAPAMLCVLVCALGCGFETEMVNLQNSGSRHRIPMAAIYSRSGTS